MKKRCLVLCALMLVFGAGSVQPLSLRKINPLAKKHDLTKAPALITSEEVAPDFLPDAKAHAAKVKKVRTYISTTIKATSGEEVDKKSLAAALKKAIDSHAKTFDGAFKDAQNSAYDDLATLQSSLVAAATAYKKCADGIVKDFNAQCTKLEKNASKKASKKTSGKKSKFSLSNPFKKKKAAADDSAASAKPAKKKSKFGLSNPFKKKKPAPAEAA